MAEERTRMVCKDCGEKYYADEHYDGERLRIWEAMEQHKQESCEGAIFRMEP